MTECSARLRQLGATAMSMEDVAVEVVQFLREKFRARDGNAACPLVRFYKTHPLGQLPEDLQSFARKAAPGMGPDVRCLTLLATAGEKPEWNDRRKSVSHQAIPLPSPETVLQAPMVAQLMRQLGLDIEAVLSPDPELLVDLAQRTFNVFHVPQAEGSAYIPAQDFVREYGVASVLGFGGILPTGDLFSVILFSCEPIPAATAEMFKPLALSVKVAVVPFATEQVFS